MRDFRKEAEQAYKAVPKQVQMAVREKARELFSGTVSLQYMRRIDHPFAARHGRPLLPILPINQQTPFWGSTRDKWRLAGSPLFGLSVVNDSKTAIFILKGTQRRGKKIMLARDFMTPLEKFAEAELERQVNAVTRRLSGG